MQFTDALTSYQFAAFEIQLGFLSSLFKTENVVGFHSEVQNIQTMN